MCWLYGLGFRARNAVQDSRRESEANILIEEIVVVDHRSGRDLVVHQCWLSRSRIPDIRACEHQGPARGNVLGLPRFCLLPGEKVFASRFSSGVCENSALNEW